MVSKLISLRRGEFFKTGNIPLLRKYIFGNIGKHFYEISFNLKKQLALSGGYPCSRGFF